MKRRTLLMCLSMQLASSRTWATVYVLVLFIPLGCFILVGSFDSQLDFTLLSLETSLSKFFRESWSENLVSLLFEVELSPFEIPLELMCWICCRIEASDLSFPVSLIPSQLSCKVSTVLLTYLQVPPTQKRHVHALLALISVLLHAGYFPPAFWPP